MNNVKSIGIIGGGTAGLVAALILKSKLPDINIELVRSKRIGIIGVGEGSTEHWSRFTAEVGISNTEVIQECDATYKSGIMFQNWGDKNYLQSIANGYNAVNSGYSYVYGQLIGSDRLPKDLVSSHAWESKVNTWFVNQEEKSPTVQFHFNTNKLNDFLTKKCAERGIFVIDDEILDVEVEEDKIKGLRGDRKNYNYDFYIDSTGFSKLLIGKLGAKWQSYSKYLKMKSAIVFPTDGLYDIPMWTRALAMDYGWMFTIPVWNRCGNGYIFDSDYITKEDAHNEVNKLLGREVEIAKHITFDPGALDKTWIGNCCAVGLSASFVEPLEASSIGTSIQQSFLLAERLLNYNQSSINLYNKSVQAILDNIRDFIVLHYLTNKTNTNFWKDVNNIELPDSLQEKLNVWKTSLPVPEDFSESKYLLFTEHHHILVMHGLGLFNIDAIQREYKIKASDHFKSEAQQIISYNEQLRCETISHRAMLEFVRTLKQENY